MGSHDLFSGDPEMGFLLLPKTEGMCLAFSVGVVLRSTRAHVDLAYGGKQTSSGVQM